MGRISQAAGQKFKIKDDQTDKDAFEWIEFLYSTICGQRLYMFFQ